MKINKPSIYDQMRERNSFCSFAEISYCYFPEVANNVTQSKVSPETIIKFFSWHTNWPYIRDNVIWLI